MISVTIQDAVVMGVPAVGIDDGSEKERLFGRMVSREFSCLSGSWIHFGSSRELSEKFIEGADFLKSS